MSEHAHGLQRSAAQQRIDAALSPTEQPGLEGWKLVPVDATIEMVKSHASLNRDLPAGTKLYARPLPQHSASALLLASRRVYEGLNKRIDDASMDCDPVPVFDGIADLHDALAAYEDKP